MLFFSEFGYLDCGDLISTHYLTYTHEYIRFIKLKTVPRKGKAFDWGFSLLNQKVKVFFFFKTTLFIQICLLWNPTVGLILKFLKLISFLLEFFITLSNIQEPHIWVRNILIPSSAPGARMTSICSWLYLLSNVSF